MRVTPSDWLVRNARRVRAFLRGGRRLTALLLPSVVLPLLAACSAEPAPYKQESYVFGTRVELTVAGLPEAQARPAAAEALADLDRLHRKLHAWQPGSDLTRLNAAFAAGRSAPVDAELAELIRDGQAMEGQADGLFDPAIGRLVALWGFHADSFAPVVPDPAALAALLAARPSMADIRLEDGTVQSRNRAVALDFGGMAKGWALDRVAVILKRHGVRDALINIGGNVLALGEKSAGTPWKIGLQHPRQPEAMAVLSLKGGEAVGTSGDYQRYFDSGGRRHCHLIDPRDGDSDCRMQAATVLVEGGPDAGLRSDVATKPIYLAGPPAARRYAGRFGIRAVLVVDGQGQAWLSPAMAARLQWLRRPDKVAALPD